MTSIIKFPFIIRQEMEKCIFLSRSIYGGIDCLWVTEKLFLEMRAIVNVSAESQLEAIAADLKRRELYDPLKSTECIYAWVAQKYYLSSLPYEFETEEVLFKIVELGNVAVFKNLRENDKYDPEHRLYKSPELCMAILKMRPDLIRYIENQTSEMRDYVLNRSIKYFKFLNEDLKEENHCWAALLHNVDMFTHVPNILITTKMIKYVIDEFDKYSKNEHSFTEKLIWFLKTSPVLLRYMIKKNPQFIIYVNWKLDDDMLEYISEHCSFEHFISIFDQMMNSETFMRDKIPSLFMRYPEMILYGKLHSKIVITEEMSVRMMECNPEKYFKFCLRTPKIYQMACEASVDFPNDDHTTE